MSEKFINARKYKEVLSIFNDGLNGDHHFLNGIKTAIETLDTMPDGIVEEIQSLHLDKEDILVVKYDPMRAPRPVLVDILKYLKEQVCSDNRIVLIPDLLQLAPYGKRELKSYLQHIIEEMDNGNNQ